MSAPGPLGISSRLWMRWKSISLPWRRKRLAAGSDLKGTVFWYLRPPSTPSSLPLSAWRRIAEPPASVKNYVDMQISPAWHSWLRYARVEPPSLEEQRNDVARQVELRKLARLADERWARKESYIAHPSSLGTARIGGERGEPAGDERFSDQTATVKKSLKAGKHTGGVPNKDGGFTKSHSSTAWQPKAWAPDSERPHKID